MPIRSESALAVFDPALDSPSNRAPLEVRVRLRRWWKRQARARPEDELLDLQVERREVPMRLALPLIAPVLLVVVVLLLREPENRVAALSLVAGTGAIAWAPLAAWLERRLDHAFWFQLLNTALFATLISALLWMFVSVEHPRIHTHWIVFFFYLALIASTGLSTDPRLSVAAGAFSAIGYLTVVLGLRAAIEAGVPMSVRVAPAFGWVTDASKLAMLAASSCAAAASAARGRALRRASTRDPLTGLLNRHSFEWCLERQARRAEASGQPLSIAMVDVDHFKAVNDRFGHQVGDEVLRFVAERLRGSVRETDMVARYGGEEFVVAFLDSADERLCERMEGWRRRLADVQLRPEGSPLELRVTVSAGVARYPIDGDSVGDVLLRADQRLYRAKHAGRNRVEDGSLPEPT